MKLLTVLLICSGEGYVLLIFVISPSRSPVDVSVPQVTSKTYSLLISDNYFIVFVDFPNAIGRNPDARGSSVPT